MNWWTKYKPAAGQPASQGGNWWEKYKPANQPEPAMPAAPAVPGMPQPVNRPMLSQPTRTLPPEPVVPVTPMTPPGPAPVPVGPGAAPPVDESSAAGDWEAGKLLFRQMLPAARVTNLATRMSDKDRFVDGRAAQLVEQADALEAALIEIPDPEQRAAAEEEVAFLRRQAELLDPYYTSADRAQKAESAALAALEVLALEDEAAAIPMNPAAQDFMQAEGFWDSLGAFAKDPAGVSRTVGLRTLPSQAPSFVGAILGQYLGGPGGAATLGGLGGAQTERTLSVAQELRGALEAAGVDVTDQAAVEAAIAANPGLFDEAIQKANTRATVIGAADAATAGIVGQVVKMTQGMPAWKRALTALLTGTVAEPAGEAGGEAAALAATGEDIRAGEVMAEALGGLLLGGPTAVGQAAVEADRTPGRALGREMDRALPGANPDAVISPLAPQVMTESPSQRVAQVPETNIPQRPAPIQRPVLEDMPVMATPAEKDSERIQRGGPAEEPDRPADPRQEYEAARQNLQAVYTAAAEGDERAIEQVPAAEERFRAAQQQVEQAQQAPAETPEPMVDNQAAFQQAGRDMQTATGALQGQPQEVPAGGVGRPVAPPATNTEVGGAQQREPGGAMQPPPAQSGEAGQVAGVDRLIERARATPELQGFADGMEGAKRAGTIDQQTLAFYEQRIAEAEARAAGGTAVQRETGVMTRTLEPIRIKQRAALPDDVESEIARAEAVVERLAGQINDAGFRTGDVNAANAPPEVREARRKISEISGQVSRVIGKGFQVAKGHKNANPQAAQDARQELARMLDEADQAPARAGPRDTDSPVSIEDRLNPAQQKQLQRVRKQDGAVAEVIAELEDVVRRARAERVRGNDSRQLDYAIDEAVGFTEDLLNAWQENGRQDLEYPSRDEDTGEWDYETGDATLSSALFFLDQVEQLVPATQWDDGGRDDGNVDRMDPDDVFPPSDEASVNINRNLPTIPQDEADAIVQGWKDTAKEIGRTEDNSNKVIISLFDYTGQWSKPWEDAGYDVIRYDIKSGADVILNDWIWNQLEEMRASGKEVYGVMAACPCTTFTNSGARWWNERHDVESKEMVRKTFGEAAVASGAKSAVEYNVMLVDATKDFVAAANPSGFHVIENPMGRIATKAGLEMPAFRFQPHNFGDPYTKKTQIFGVTATDLPTANVDPTQGSLMHKKGSGDPTRSTTPLGFAYSFFMANDPVARERMAAPAEQPAVEADYQLKGAKLFRGTGRGVAMYANTPIAGPATYWAFSRDVAESYGGDIQEGTLDLSNPLVIDSDQEWRALTKEAGWEFPNPFGLGPDRVKEMTQGLKNLVLSKGHDGIIVTFDPSSQYDVDPATGKGLKTLRDVFRDPQVIDYRAQTDAAAKPVDELGNPVPDVTTRQSGATAAQAKEQVKERQERDKKAADARRDKAQADLDSYVDELAAQAEDLYPVGPSTPKLAEDVFNSHMDAIESYLSSIKQERGLDEAEMPVLKYTLRRPSGQTTYRIETYQHTEKGSPLQNWRKQMMRGMTGMTGKSQKPGNQGMPAVSKKARFSDALDYGPRPGRRPGKGLSPGFLKFSFNNRSSVYTAAFRDAGLDPDAARNMPLDKQVEVLKKVIKDRYGIDVRMGTYKVKAKNILGRKRAVERTDLSPRKAIDQMLDAYQTLEMMAATLGVPHKALGLPINGKGLTLDLTTTRRLGALGMFAYGGGQRVIYMPDRSNSFAHEWGHALDHYLNSVVNRGEMQKMLTRKMTGEVMPPPLSPKRPLTDAFAQIIEAMFGNNAWNTSVKLRAQVDAAQVDAQGNPTPRAKEAQKFLTMMREGKRPPRKYLSQYALTSEQFDEMAGTGGYFADPAEMFARAFEAYIGQQIARMTDAPQSFLSKGGWAYDDDNDPRLRLTFPKGMDGDRIAVAMGALAQQLRIAEFGQGEVPTFPKNPDRLATLLIDGEVKDLGFWQREKKNIRETAAKIADLGRLMRREPVRAAESTWGLLKQQMIHSVAGTLHDLSRKYNDMPQAKKVVDNISALIGKRPGYGQFTGELWQQEVEQNSRRDWNLLNHEAKKIWEDGVIPDAEKEGVFLALAGFENHRKVRPHHKKFAARVRRVMDDIWYKLDGVGLKPGYRRGYMPFIHDIGKADADPRGFREKAQKVYELMYAREVIDNTDEEAQVADIRQTIRILEGRKRPTTDGRYTEVDVLDGEARDLIDAWRAARKEVSRIKSAIKQAEKQGRDTDKLEEKLVEASGLENDARGELMSALQPLWARESAIDWQTQSGVGALNDYDSMGPNLNFLKGRRLPDETPTIMGEFMDMDPMSVLNGYITSSWRKIQYHKAFGEWTPENPDGKDLRTMLEAARQGGMTEADITVLKQAVNAATGRFTGNLSGMSRLYGRANAYGQMALLTFATLTSLHEMTTAGLRSGHIRDSFKAVAQNIRGIRRKSRQELYDLARFVGVVSDHTFENIMENRMSLDAMEVNARDRERIAKFHQMTRLAQWTQYNRVMNMPVAHGMVHRLLRDAVRGERTLVARYQDAISGKGRGSFADAELNELGIPAEEREAMLDWIESLDGKLPRQADLMGPDGDFNPAGRLWSRAVWRMTMETIQEPMKTDRTMGANHPTYAAMYGIMSFIDAFHRNIVLRTLRRGVGENAGLPERVLKGAANSAVMVAPYMMGYAFQVLSTLFREELLNGDKLDDLEDDEYLDFILKRAFFRTGIMGRFDPLLQLATNVKYETDLTNIYAGPYQSFFLSNIQTMISAMVGRNSENTNTAEHNAAQAFYRGVVQPIAAATITSIFPASGLVGTGGSLGLYWVGRYDTSKRFADKLVGEKGTEYDGDRPWWELGDGLF